MKKLLLPLLLLTSVQAQSFDWDTVLYAGLVWWHASTIKSEWDIRNAYLKQKQAEQETGSVQQEVPLTSAVEESTKPNSMPMVPAVHNIGMLTPAVATMQNNQNTGIYCLSAIVVVGLIYGGYALYQHAKKANRSDRSLLTY